MTAVFFGLMYQIVVAVGLIWIAEVARDANPIVKANFMLVVAGGVALVALALGAFGGSNSLEGISWKDLLHLSFGAFLVLVLGEMLYITGLSRSNATSMAYTALAFPAVSLLLEVITLRIPVSSLTGRDFCGMVLLAAGFVLVASREPH